MKKTKREIKAALTLLLVLAAVLLAAAIGRWGEGWHDSDEPRSKVEISFDVQSDTIASERTESQIKSKKTNSKRKKTTEGGNIRDKSPLDNEIRRTDGED